MVSIKRILYINGLPVLLSKLSFLFSISAVRTSEKLNIPCSTRIQRRRFLHVPTLKEGYIPLKHPETPWLHNPFPSQIVLFLNGMIICPTSSSSISLPPNRRMCRNSGHWGRLTARMREVHIWMSWGSIGPKESPRRIKNMYDKRKSKYTIKSRRRLQRICLRYLILTCYSDTYSLLLNIFLRNIYSPLQLIPQERLRLLQMRWPRT